MSKPMTFEEVERLPSCAPRITVRAGEQGFIERHNHDFFELVYIRSGFCLHEADERMTLITEGDIFIILPGQSHRYLGNRVVKLYNCIFCAECLPPMLKAHPVFEHSDPTCMHLELPERKTMLGLLAAMRTEIDEQGPAWETKITGLLWTVLAEYVRARDRRAPDGEKSGYFGYITPALDYIDRHYDQEITMRDLANEAGVSCDYLTRQFRPVAGITLLTYLRRYRIARAMDLLSSGLSVTDAAERVGFRSLSHFSREFKRELGLTPSQYRAQNTQ